MRKLAIRSRKIVMARIMRAIIFGFLGNLIEGLGNFGNLPISGLGLGVSMFWLSVCLMGNRF